MAKLTDTQYLQRGGNVCPACESDDIEGDAFEADSNIASQYVKCNDCGASWSDLYRLTGYADLSNAKGEPL